MSSTQAFVELLQRLMSAQGGSIARMRTLSRIWQFLSRLSAEERTQLVTELGIEGGEEALRRFLSSPGTEAAHLQAWGHAVLQAVDLKSAEAAAARLAQGHLRPAAARAVVEVLERVGERLQQEKTPPVPAAPVDDEPPAEDAPKQPPPSPQPEGAVAASTDRADLPVQPPVAAPDPADRPKTPAPPAGPAASEPVSAALRSAPTPAPSPGRTGRSSAASLARRPEPSPEVAALCTALGRIPSPVTRYLVLMKALDSLPLLDRDAAAALLDCLKPGWMRRRALERLLALGSTGDNEGWIELCVEQCTSAADFLLAGTRLLAARTCTPAEREALSAGAPTPAAARRIARRGQHP